MKRQSFKLLITIICVLAAGICYSCSRQAGRTEDGGQVLEFSGETLFPETQSDTGLEYNDAADSELETGAKPAASFTQDAVCYVHVCGEVMRPGVYEMKPGSRVFQAVEQAGGFTQKAAQEYLNLAGEIQDGMKIVVPSQGWEDGDMPDMSGLTDSGVTAAGEMTSQTDTIAPGIYPPSGKADSLQTAESSRININTAAKEELMTLKGIGPARAEDIVRYREEHGPFQSVEEIMDVPGIKNNAFEKIKDDIAV